MQGNIVADGRH